MVGARRFERVGSRKDHRNGTYLRRLLTSLGQIDVMVPRSREGGSAADVMGRYRRRSEEVDEMMVEAYVSGVSQRKMGDVTEALLGERVGRSTVRLVAKRLDGAVEALRSAPIEGPHPYLYLDATFLDARWARKVENVSALVAYAVDPDGHRRLLAITLGPEESEDSWSELLEQLLERGLSGVELVIADEQSAGVHPWGWQAALRKAAAPASPELQDRGRAARLPLELSGLGGRRDGSSARSHRSGAGACGPEQSRGGKRPQFWMFM